jgi:hypothetical protein
LTCVSSNYTTAESVWRFLINKSIPPPPTTTPTPPHPTPPPTPTPTPPPPHHHTPNPSYPWAPDWVNLQQGFSLTAAIHCIRDHSRRFLMSNTPPSPPGKMTACYMSGAGVIISRSLIKLESFEKVQAWMTSSLYSSAGAFPPIPHNPSMIRGRSNYSTLVMIPGEGDLAPPGSTKASLCNDQVSCVVLCKSCRQQRYSRISLSGILV